MAASPQIASLLGRRGRLELDELLAALVVDGYLLAEDAKQVRMGARAGRSTVELHPLVSDRQCQAGQSARARSPVEPGRR